MGKAAEQWDPPHEVTLVGISESRGVAEAYAFLNVAILDVPAHKMVPLAEGLVIPADLPFLEGLAGSSCDPARADRNSESHGLQLLEAQRAKAWSLGIDGPPRKAVGGFAQATEIRSGDIRTRILRRWPDKVGEKIGKADPTSSDHFMRGAA